MAQNKSGNSAISLLFNRSATQFAKKARDSVNEKEANEDAGPK